MYMKSICSVAAHTDPRVDEEEDEGVCAGLCEVGFDNAVPSRIYTTKCKTASGQISADFVEI